MASESNNRSTNLISKSYISWEIRIILICIPIGAIISYAIFGDDILVLPVGSMVGSVIFHDYSVLLLGGIFGGTIGGVFAGILPMLSKTVSEKSRKTLSRIFSIVLIACSLSMFLGLPLAIPAVIYSLIVSRVTRKIYLQMQKPRDARWSFGILLVIGIVSVVICAGLFISLAWLVLILVSGMT